MTDNDWSIETQEKAIKLLPIELGYLSCELGMYIDISPEELPGNRVDYTLELSNVFHRLGRAGAIAEAAKNDGAVYTINQIISSLKTLLNNINYAGALADLSIAHGNLVSLLADLKNRQHIMVDMGELKE